MEFFSHMNFLFWASLFFLLGFALCIHFDVYGLKTKLNNWFLSVFSAVLPNDKENINQELKSNMAKAATFIFYVAVFILLISIFLAFALPYSLSEEDNKYTGPLGDLFNGLLTPFLTFLTFCGLLITIMIQNVQMKSTLQELELTRKEMAESTDALQEQVKNSSAQKFDSNFYEMLRFHMEVMKDYLSGSVIEKEYGAINKLGGAWKNFLYPDKIRSLSLINYQLLKFISDNEKDKTITETKAKNYANIVRATIYEDVIGLFFINILQDKFEKSKTLVEHYEFFEHLAFSKFSNPFVINRISLYEKEVFGDKLNLKKFYLEKGGELLSFALEEIEGNYKVLFELASSIPKEIFPEYEYANDFPLDELIQIEDKLNDYKLIIAEFDIYSAVSDENIFNAIIHKKADQFLNVVNIDKISFFMDLKNIMILMNTFVENNDDVYGHTSASYKKTLDKINNILLLNK